METTRISYLKVRTPKSCSDCDLCKNSYCNGLNEPIMTDARVAEKFNIRKDILDECPLKHVVA